MTQNPQSYKLLIFGIKVAFILLMRLSFQQLLVLFCLSLSIQACGDGSVASNLFGSSDSSAASSSETTQDVSRFFNGQYSEILIDVAYEPGAEPFVGTTSSGTQLWSLTHDNIAALYSHRSFKPTITVPFNLQQMTLIADQNKDSWTPDQIMQLGATIPTSKAGSNIGRILVIYLNGKFNDNGTVSNQTLGAQVTGTTVIAIFKDVVIATSGNPSGIVAKYVEQSTIIHEIGHALGLVNNGLPLSSTHQDTDHGHHCNNPNCVMNWQNSGATQLIQFAQQASSSGSNILFGSECIQDASDYAP